MIKSVSIPLTTLELLKAPRFEKHLFLSTLKIKKLLKIGKSCILRT